MIFRQFRVRYHRAHVSRLLHALGWSVQKPERRALERNEERIQQWKRETWPRMAEELALRIWAAVGDTATALPRRSERT